MKRTPTDIPKTSKEMVLEASKLSDAEARFMVANYYDEQELRKRADMQLRHLGDKALPEFLPYAASIHATFEDRIKSLLGNSAKAAQSGGGASPSMVSGRSWRPGSSPTSILRRRRRPVRSGASPTSIRTRSGRKARSGPTTPA